MLCSTRISAQQGTHGCLLRACRTRSARTYTPGSHRAVRAEASAASSSGCAIAASILLLASPVGAADQTPYQLADTLPMGALESSTSLRACPSNINPNCVSTASTNDTYGPAWRASEVDPARAARVLEDAVFDLFGLDGARVLATQELKGGGQYLRFGVDSNFGQDILEFLIKTEGGRSSSGSEGALVTYRSMAGSVRYVWPIQQPVTDFDTQRKRLAAIRERVGWSVIGCELIECYMQ